MRLALSGSQVRPNQARRHACPQRPTARGDYPEAGRRGDYPEAGRRGDYPEAGRRGDYPEAGRQIHS